MEKLEFGKEIATVAIEKGINCNCDGVLTLMSIGKYNKKVKVGEYYQGKYTEKLELVFKNTKSIDVLIENLEDLRASMIFTSAC